MNARKNPAAMEDGAKLRLRGWLQQQKESPAKALARQVAKAWDTDGEDAAVKLFRAECAAQNMVRWAQIAVSDMAVAYRANPDLYA